MKKTNIVWFVPLVGVVAAVRSTNGADFSSQTFDYVVVGGGTAGLALAARLSDNPKISVGVIEAGPYFENDPLIDTPALAGQLQGNAKYDWMFNSTPQSHVNNRVLPMPRGKALGGSSAINLMALDRASKIEYDVWEKLGNPGWNWDGLLPYMKAAEHFTDIDPFRANSTGANPGDIFSSQGTKGPIAASFNTWYSDIVVPYREALANLDVPINFNLDSGDPFGLYNSATAVNRTTGARSYAANTYFAYNSGRPNFVVLTGAQATKVQFKNALAGKSDRDLTATGVSFVYNSTTYTVKAKREVILSAGAFQTPQLLELSGIGSSTILRQNGITPLVELPGIGENLQDHLLVPSTYELKPGPTTLDILRNNATYVAAAQAQYATTHDGIYTASTSTLCFLDLEYITTPEKLANMIKRLDHEILADGTTTLQKAQYATQRDWLTKRVGNLEVVLTQAYGGTGTPKANTSYASIQVVIQHPFSRGNVHINSPNPLISPLINPNYFSKSIDRETLIQALKFALKISQTEPLASLVVSRQDPPPEISSDEAYADYIKANVRTIFHPIGTAALAPRAIGGVVDTSLKVYGTSNVRVHSILSAGTYQSPHLLELSGVGNSTILQKYGIKTLIDLPGVGENLQDHMLLTTTYELKPGSSTRNYDALRNNATFAVAAAAQYNATHDGILASTPSVISFTNLEPMVTATEIANMTAQIDREIISEDLTSLQKASYKIQREWLNEKVGWVEFIIYPGYAGVGVPKANTSYMTIFTSIQHPFSRGSIHLNSSDPLAPPVIDPNYFSKSIDMDTVVHSVRFAQKLSKTEPLGSIVLNRQDPAPEVTTYADIADYVKTNIGTTDHPIGSVSLAPKKLGGVVDSNLIVYGTSNLRVADASIMPLHIATHISRTVYGIGEKAAKIIKGGF